MSKSGGKFDDWIGTLKFSIERDKIAVIFQPDGIKDSSEDHSDCFDSIIKFEASTYRTAGAKYFGGDGDTRPLLSSDLGRKLGEIDVKRKVKVSGVLVMSGSVPTPLDFITPGKSKSGFVCQEVCSFEWGTAVSPRVIVNFSSISNL